MNMTVAQRLYIMIAFSLTGLTGLTWFTHQQMDKIYESANYGTVNTVPSLLVLGDALINFQNLHGIGLKHVATTEPAQKTELDKSIQAKKAAIEKNLKDYEPLLSNDEDKRLLDVERDLLQTYYAGLEQALIHSRGNDNERARLELQRRSEAESKVEKAIVEHFWFNKKLCDEGSAVAITTKESAISIAIALSLSVMAFIAGIGMWLVRILKRQLGGEPGAAAELANKIAVGDLSSRIILNAGDTVSVMAAMKHMSDTIKALLDEMDRMSREHEKGDIDVVVDSKKFQGSFQSMAQGVNDMVGAHIAVKKKAMACIKQFGEGDLEAPMEKLPGKKAFINDTIEQLRGNLKQIVGEIRDIVAKANQGDFSTKMNLSGKQGYTKELSELLNQLSNTVDTAFKDTIFVAQALEEGDLTKTVTRDYEGAYDQVKQSLNNTVATLARTIGEVTAAADQLGNASQQISATSQSLSQSSSEQAASVEEASASVEQMSSSINQNAENAQVTDGMAGKANKEAVEGGMAVKQTVEAMKSIAGKIGIIDDIAYQTNMLALNAAIEAARAGDHGKGFAVVAAEVRKLAERSQKAAGEIGELAESSVHTAELAGKLLDEIVPSIAKTSDLVQEIAAASNEQACGVGQINTAMNQMNQITQQNASASEQLAATAEEMTSQAEQLQSLMSFFKLDGRKSGARMAVVSGGKSKARTAAPAGLRGVGSEFGASEFERF